MAADQSFCAGCGFTLLSPTLSAAMEPMVPPAPAEDAAAAQPVAPPAWSVPPAPVTPANASGLSYQASPAAPAAPAVVSAGLRTTPRMLAIVGVVLAVAVGAYLFMNKNSDSGGITFTPSTLSCSTPVAFMTAAHLPASVQAEDRLTVMRDGKSAGWTSVPGIGSDAGRQADGSWVITTVTIASDMQTLCNTGGSGGFFSVLTPGTHTIQILDASGTVLSQGSYTVTA
jgi:hypothetical protein